MVLRWVCVTEVSPECSLEFWGVPALDYKVSKVAEQASFLSDAPRHGQGSTQCWCSLPCREFQQGSSGEAVSSGVGSVSLLTLSLSSASFVLRVSC